MPADLARACADLGIGLSETQLDQLAAYRDLFARRAAEFNLTAVRDLAGIERRHLLESLALGRLLADRGILAQERPRLLDIGSGAGLPGLPLKIAWPWLQLTLLDANEKRCDFLREVIAALELAGAQVLSGRAEAVGHDPAHREAYDLVVARAVAPLPVLLEYGVPFLRVDGLLVAQKGGAATRELAESGAALRALHAAVEAVVDFEPLAGPAQKVVIVRKTAATPSQLPRRVGVPSKRPLS